jgi:Domain of unknown function (DUF6456)
LKEKTRPFSWQARFLKMLEQKANMTPGLAGAIRRVMRLLGTGQRALVRRGNDFVVVTPRGKRVRGASAVPASVVAELRRLELVVPGDGERLVGRAPTLRGARRQAESPLLWLAQRRDGDGQPLISQEEFAAGERLRRDFELAQMVPRVTALWGVEGAVSTTGGRRSGLPLDGLPTTERVLQARTRLDRALKAAGEGLATILLEVCCLERGIEAAERRLGWPSRSGKVVLRLALARLALHYGLRRPAEPSRGGFDCFGLQPLHHGG